MWRSRETERSPAVISLVVSRCQKNIQVWEKTYPGCRGMESGDSMAGLRIRTSSRLPGRAKPGGRRQHPAAQVASPVAPGGQDSFFKFRFGASFTRISRTTNPVHRLDRKRCLPPWTNHSLQFKPSPNNPSRFCQGPAGGLRGSRKRGGGGEGSAGRARSSPRRRAEGRCGELPFPALLDSLLSLFYCSRSILPEVNSTNKSLFSRQWLL